jgi:HD-GYP domain-containing protein (c-di-GMP phosphodiesterase class II)
MPRGLAGEAISLPSRLAAVAFAAVMFHHAGGREAAAAAVLRWSGRALDPSLAEAFLQRRDEYLELIEVDDVWSAALAAEPSPHRLVPEGKIDEVAHGFADFVDLKSPYLQGHSTGVATLAEGAARACNLAEADAIALRRAALFHDLGRAGVSTRVWEKRGPLTTAEWEQVRLHAYHTERILSRSPSLAALGRLAGLHHERTDGSGYHRGAPASLQSKAARILAAADVYQALTEERPHRAARAAEAAARVLEAQPGLDREAVAAVLEAAGQRQRRVQTPWPAGLSAREVEVLRLLARGHSERKIAETLFISTSTVHTHVTHIYEKAEVTTRASVALFAMQHGLLQS